MPGVVQGPPESGGMCALECAQHPNHGVHRPFQLRPGWRDLVCVLCTQLRTDFPDQELAEPITSVEDLEEYSRTKLGDLQSLSSTLLEHLNFKPEQEACVGWGVGGGEVRHAQKLVRSKSPHGIDGFFRPDPYPLH